MIWSIRLSMACYLVRIVLSIRRCNTSNPPSNAVCFCWWLGCLLYLTHAVLAFEQVHNWSHAAAVEHTEKETERMTGLARGEGIWANYLFTIIWIADAVRLTAARLRNRPTNRRLDLAVHLLFAFMFLNATVVFGPSFYRVLAVPVALALAAAYFTRPVARNAAEDS